MAGLTIFGVTHVDVDMFTNTEAKNRQTRLKFGVANSRPNED
jgi:hypothetical protein